MRKCIDIFDFDFDILLVSDLHRDRIGAYNKCLSIEIIDHFVYLLFFEDKTRTALWRWGQRIFVVAFTHNFMEFFINPEGLVIAKIKDPLISTENSIASKCCILHKLIFGIHLISIILFIVKISLFSRVQTIVIRILFWVGLTDPISFVLFKQLIVIVFVVDLLILLKWIFKRLEVTWFNGVRKVLIFYIGVYNENVGKCWLWSAEKFWFGLPELTSQVLYALNCLGTFFLHTVK